MIFVFHYFYSDIPAPRPNRRKLTAGEKDFFINFIPLPSEQQQQREVEFICEL